MSKNTIKGRFCGLKIYWIILLAGGFALLLLAVFAMSLGEEKQKTTKITLPYQNGSVEISSVYVDGEEYFFVPSFVEEEEVEKIKKSSSAEVVVSADVPTLFVNTASSSMDAVYKDKEHKEQVSFSIIDEEGALTVSSAQVKIKGRGNTTWYKKKKPFHVEFEEKISLLGMGEKEDWILLANVYDKSMIRNAVVLDAAENIGLENTVEYRYVDVYLNGEYNGLYMLTEAVDSFAKEEGSGFMLCSAELPERLDDADNGFLLGSDIGIVIEYPKTLTKDEKSAVIGTIEEADEIICSGNADIGQFIDIDSWAKRYLIDEVFENIDAGLASSYFYWKENKQGNSVIYCGPVWDYDNSLANQNSMNEGAQNPEIIFAANNERGESIKMLWYKALYDNPVFYGKVVELYQRVVREEMIRIADGGMIEKEKLIKTAKKTDELRWNVTEDTSSEITEMQEWLARRIRFLDSIWIEGEKYNSVIFEDEGKNYKRFAIPDGSTVFDDEYYKTLITDTHCEWIDKETGEVFSLDTPVYSDIHLVKAGMKKQDSEETKDAVKFMLLYAVVLLMADFTVREIRLKKY